MANLLETPFNDILSSDLFPTTAKGSPALVYLKQSIFSPIVTFQVQPHVLPPGSKEQMSSILLPVASRLSLHGGSGRTQKCRVY